MKGLRLLLVSLAVGALLASLGVAAADKSGKTPLEADPLVLNPPASAAPAGNWSYIEPYGYLWVPAVAMGATDAEWAPWDPWWAMPYGRWTWATGCGWGWTPVIPPHSMSPLGWGFDSWYGGWYGYTPDGNPANTMGEYNPDNRGYYSYCKYPGWWKTNGYKGHDPQGARPGRSRTEPSKVKIATIVASPPKALAPPPMQRHRIDDIEDRDLANQSRGYAQHRDRGDRQHGEGPGHGQGQGKGHGGSGGNGRTEPGKGSPPPVSIGGGSSSGPRPQQGEQRKRR
jgi:uncharacterized membrane protein YgcG